MTRKYFTIVILGIGLAILNELTPALAAHNGRKAHVVFVRTTISFGTAPLITLRQFARPRATAVSPDVVSLLQRMAEAMQSTSSDGVQTTTVFKNGAGIAVVSTQRVRRDGLNGLRMDYTSPPNMNGTIMIDDGVNYSRFDPQRQKAMVKPSTLRLHLRGLSNLPRAYRKGNLLASIVGQATIAGRPTTILRVERISALGAYRRMWLDNATGCVLKVEQYGPAGRLIHVTQYQQIAFNVNLTPGTFSLPAASGAPPPVYTLPPTPAAASKEAGFTVLQPGYLPAGYTFQSVAVDNFRQKKMVHLRYLSGVNILSIFQTVEYAPNTQIQLSRPNAVTAVRSNRRIVIVSSEPTPELARIINSMR